MSAGFSDLKLSSVPMMSLTCSYSSVSSCLTWLHTEEGECCVSMASQNTLMNIPGLMCTDALVKKNARSGVKGKCLFRLQRQQSMDKKILKCQH